MKNLILTERSCSANISSTRVILLPSSFRIEVKIESSARCFIYQIIDDKGRILTSRHLTPDQEYQLLIPHLTEIQRTFVIERLSESIEFELLYFICHGRCYGMDDSINLDDLEDDRLEFDLEGYSETWTIDGTIAIEQAICL